MSAIGNSAMAAAEIVSPARRAGATLLVTVDCGIVAHDAVARARDAEWHADYTWPGLKRFFMPDPRLHGAPSPFALCPR